MAHQWRRPIPRREATSAPSVPASIARTKVAPAPSLRDIDELGTFRTAMERRRGQFIALPVLFARSPSDA